MLVTFFLFGCSNVYNAAGRLQSLILKPYCEQFFLKTPTQILKPVI